MRQESMVKPRVVSAVALARCVKDGVKPETYKAKLRRAIQKQIVRMIHNRLLPIDDGERIFRIAYVFGLLQNMLSGASMADTFENDIMKLIFNATAIANIADNASASPLTALYMSLHTSDPGEGGAQNTSEIGYTSYARVAINRNSGGFVVTANSVSPQAAVNFPAGTGGAGTAAYAGVGTASSGAGKLLFSGTVTPNIICGNGVTPQLTTATAITID